jgi:hypothetical protein
LEQTEEFLCHNYAKITIQQITIVDLDLMMMMMMMMMTMIINDMMMIGGEVHEDENENIELIILLVS